MTQSINHTNKRSKSSWLNSSFLPALALCSSAFAEPIAYTYDNLNRLTKANYNNGQQVITYTYDAVGNILTRTTTAAEKLAPTLTITRPLNGTVTNRAAITATGTATDAGQGDSGIASVTVNMLPADNGIATGADSTNWSLNLGLGVGTNDFTVIATDGSTSANQTTDNVSVVYLPLIVDIDNDGLPDIWETANNVKGPKGDPDLDGINNLQEYLAGTDPRDKRSKPEGSEGVNYVLFRDHFDNNQYKDRWYLSTLIPGTDYTLNEAGTNLQSTIQRPASACSSLRYQSFAAIDATNVVYHVKLQLDGFGVTTVGFMQDQARQNRIEVLFNNGTAPYLTVQSANKNVLTKIPVARLTPYQKTPVDVRITKKKAQYSVYVNGVHQASVNNKSLGNKALRPYVIAKSCLSNDGFLDTKIDLAELLIDRDGDGRADTREDANANGVVDTNESNPQTANMDGDTLLDGHDNCLFVDNEGQRDSDGDGYGNRCDADFDNNNRIDFADLGYLKSKFFTDDADADLNGDGRVDFEDLSLLKSMFFTSPGPSGTMP